MFKLFKRISFILCSIAVLTLFAVPLTQTVAYATTSEQTQANEQSESEISTDETQDYSIGSKAIAAGICVGLAAALGALAMGIAIAKSNEAIARQPEATSQIKSGLMLGLVFIETAIIYALIVAILVIFVL